MPRPRAVPRLQEPPPGPAPTLGADAGVEVAADAAIDAPSAPPPVAVVEPVPCAADEKEPPPPTHDQLTLTKATFTDSARLGRRQARRGGAVVPALVRQARGRSRTTQPVGHDGHGGKAKQWRKACAAAAKLKAGDDAAAQAMFEAEFVPCQAAGKAGPDGKLTGYFVQELRASRNEARQVPVPDLRRARRTS